jgi:hypothetical protein
MITININHSFKTQQSCNNQKVSSFKPIKFSQSQDNCLQGIRQGVNNIIFIENMLKTRTQMAKFGKENLEIKNTKKCTTINPKLFKNQSKLYIDITA